MRIGIDARFLTHPQAGGFKTYTQSLIAGLAEVDAENEYRLYVDRSPEVPFAYGPNFLVCVVPGELPLIGMAWREQIGLARQVGQDRLDLLHSLSLTAPLRCPCPTVVTIHDMIWRQTVRPSSAKASLKHSVMDAYYRYVPERAARAAAAVITVSEDARGHILRELGLPPDRVRVTHEAAAARFRTISDPAALAAVRAKFGLPPDFVLAMGSADPRKNVPGLLAAYAALPADVQEQHPLAVVWAHRHLAESLAAQTQALGIGDRLHFLQGVSDEELVLLYNAAAVFAFPSRYEGFGLPLLEAMACGTPVVAADNSSIPEIVGDAALLVDAEDAAGLTDALCRALTDVPLRASLSRQGMERAAGFSWARCARETLAIYAEAVRGR